MQKCWWKLWSCVNIRRIWWDFKTEAWRHGTQHFPWQHGRHSRKLVSGKWHIPSAMFTLHKRWPISSLGKLLHFRILLVMCDLSPLPKHHQLTNPLPTALAIFEGFWGKNNCYWFNTGSNSTQLVLTCICCFISANIYVVIYESEIGGRGALLNVMAISGNRAEKCRKRAGTCCKRAKVHRGVL